MFNASKSFHTFELQLAALSETRHTLTDDVAVVGAVLVVVLDVVVVMWCERGFGLMFSYGN